jgi:hypothetical protein
MTMLTLRIEDIGYGDACPYRVSTLVDSRLFDHYGNEYFNLLDKFNENLRRKANLKDKAEITKRRKEAITVKCQKCGRERKTQAWAICKCFYCGRNIAIEK